MIDVVCAVIEDEAGRILACRRPHGKHLGGLWEFPGGKVDPGESLAAALDRELREELGIEIEVTCQLLPVDWDYGAKNLRLHPFVGSIRRGDPHPHEHDEIRWCAEDDWDRLEWAPADVPILAMLRDRGSKRPVDSATRTATVPDP